MTSKDSIANYDNTDGELCVLCDEIINDFDSNLSISHDGIHISSMKSVITAFPSTVRGWPDRGKLKKFNILGLLKTRTKVFYIHGKCGNKVILDELNRLNRSRKITYMNGASDETN